MRSKTINRLLLLCCAFAACNAQRGKCSDSGDRCVPKTWCPDNNVSGTKLQYCSSRYAQVPRVCCSENAIVCSTPERTTGKCQQPDESILKLSPINRRNRECYTHNRVSYYCVEPPPPEKKERQSVATVVPSVFEACTTTTTNRPGFKVPSILCVAEKTKLSPQHVCCVPTNDTTRLVGHSKAKALRDTPCGRTRGITDKITFGQPTIKDEFPWMATLMDKNSNLQCGGTLIHASYVLTAKHCLLPMPKFVVLGSYDLQTLQDNQQKINVEKPFRHPELDVALLRLVKPAELIDYVVEPICLPVYVDLLMRKPKTMIITGWGRTENLQKTQILQKAFIHVNATCTKDSLICAGGLDKSNHCSGDSGGPYQLLERIGKQHRYVQYGVISTGKKFCSRTNTESEGVMVGYVLQWILNTLKL